jgi:hypothetical protein
LLNKYLQITSNITAAVKMKILHAKALEIQTTN